MVVHPQWLVLAFSILTSLFNCALFIIIKFNDMKHFHNEFEEFKKNNEKFGEANKKDHENIVRILNDVNNRVAVREGLCEERHHKK